MPKSPAHVDGAQPSKTTGTGRHGMDLRGDDLYPTPRALTLALARVEPLGDLQTIWEPAAGMGHMAAALSETGLTVLCSDLIDYGVHVPGSPPIRAPVDFLGLPDSDLPEPTPRAIITNPPFHLSAPFVRRGLSLCNHVYILNRLAFLEGKARADILNNHLRKVYVFENRPPMMHRWSRNPATGLWEEWAGKKSDSAMAMAWFCFQAEPRKDTVFEMQRIRWLKEDMAELKS